MLLIDSMTQQSCILQYKSNLGGSSVASTLASDARGPGIISVHDQKKVSLSEHAFLSLSFTGMTLIQCAVLQLGP